MGRTKAAIDGKDLGKPKYGRGKHPNSKKNLEATMARPGDVKNPKGKPPGTPDRATVIRALMDTEINVQDPTKPKGVTMKVSLYSAAALGQFRAAMNGSTQAWKEIQDSLHGKVPDKVEQSGPNGGPIQTENKHDLSKLSTEQLIALKDINKKLNS